MTLVAHAELYLITFSAIYFYIYDKIFAVASSGTVQISKLSNGVYEYIARMRDFIAQCPLPASVKVFKIH